MRARKRLRRGSWTADRPSTKTPLPRSPFLDRCGRRRSTKRERSVILLRDRADAHPFYRATTSRINPFVRGAAGVSASEYLRVQMAPSPSREDVRDRSASVRSLHDVHRYWKLDEGTYRRRGRLYGAEFSRTMRITRKRSSTVSGACGISSGRASLLTLIFRYRPLGRWNVTRRKTAQIVTGYGVRLRCDRDEEAAENDRRRITVEMAENPERNPVTVVNGLDSYETRCAKWLFMHHFHGLHQRGFADYERRGRNELARDGQRYRGAERSVRRVANVYRRRFEVPEYGREPRSTRLPVFASHSKIRPFNSVRASSTVIRVHVPIARNENSPI